MSASPRRIGVLVPSNNVVLEPELYRGLPMDVAAHFARLRVASSGPEHVRQMSTETGRAVAEMPVGLGVLAYACLSTSLVNAAWEARFEELAKGAATAIVTAAAATLTALSALGARRIAVLTPYPPSIDALVPGWFAANGFEPVRHSSMGIDDIHEVGRRSAAEVAQAARSVAGAGADAVCILATDLRTLEVITELERDIRLPVVTTNQALLWYCLNSVGVGEVRGPGTLFGIPLRNEDAP